MLLLQGDYTTILTRRKGDPLCLPYAVTASTSESCVCDVILVLVA